MFRKTHLWGISAAILLAVVLGLTIGKKAATPPSPPSVNTSTMELKGEDEVGQVRPRLAPGKEKASDGNLSVHVRREEGGPLSGADVSLSLVGAGNRGKTRLIADRDGQVVFSVGVGKVYAVDVAAAGYVPKRVHLKSPAVVEVVLQHGATVYLTASSLWGGDEGGQVRLRTVDSRRAMRNVIVAGTETCIGAYPPGPLRVYGTSAWSGVLHVVGNGLVPETGEVRFPISVPLRRVAAIRARNAAGEVIPDWGCSFSWQVGSDTEEWKRVARSSTEESGVYSLLLSNERLRLRVQAEGCAPGYMDVPRGVSFDDGVVDLVLARGIKLSVVIGGDSDVDEVIVRVIRVEGSERGDSGSLAFLPIYASGRAKSNLLNVSIGGLQLPPSAVLGRAMPNEGVAEFPGIPANAKLLVTAGWRGVVVGRKSIQTESGSYDLTVRVECHDSWDQEFMVVDSAGKPVDSAIVYVATFVGPGGSPAKRMQSTVGTLETDVGGMFSLVGVDPSKKYVMKIHALGVVVTHEFYPASGAESCKSLAIVSMATETVRVYVKDAAGYARAGILVIASIADERMRSYVTDSLGCALCEIPFDESCLFIAVDPESGFRAFGQMNDSNEVELELETMSEVSRVEVDLGNGSGNISIDVLKGEQVLKHSEGFVDGVGVFLVPGVPPGEYSVRVRLSDREVTNGLTVPEARGGFARIRIR